jgi:hypothetical protein
MLTKFILGINGLMISYVWVDKMHYQLTLKSSWVAINLVEMLGILTFCFMISVLLFLDKEEKWIPIHGMMRIWLRSFCSSLSTPLTFLVLKVSIGVQEVGSFVKGFVEVRYIYDPFQLKRIIDELRRTDEKFFSYLNKKGLIEDLIKEANGSAIRLKELLGEKRVQMIQDRSWFETVWDWVASHPEEIAIGCGFLLVTGLCLSLLVDQSALWKTIDVMLGRGQYLTAEMARLMEQNSVQLSQLGNQVAVLSQMLVEYSPLLDYLQRNEVVIRQTLGYSGTLSHFAQGLLVTSDGVGPIYTPTQRIDALIMLANHVLTQTNHPTGADVSA